MTNYLGLGAFLDLLAALHGLCVSGQEPELSGATAWYASASDALAPQQLESWLGLAKEPLSIWELRELPPGWDEAWRILSPRETTLTAEALDYLEAHRPGAVAAALPKPPELPTLDEETLPGGREDWPLDDAVLCVSREVQRRETVLPAALEAGKITAERAANELGQMRSALAWLQRLQKEQGRPQQGQLL